MAMPIEQFSWGCFDQFSLASGDIWPFFPFTGHNLTTKQKNIERCLFEVRVALSFVASSTAIDKDTAVFRQETLAAPELLAVRRANI